jgi:hypothetical protein
MSFTQVGWDRIIKGHFKDGFVRGTFGIQLNGIDPKEKTATVKLFIISQEDQEILFEYDNVHDIKVGNDITVITGAEVKSKIQVGG